MSGPQAAMLHDGKRLHLNHGPIDLIIEAFGPAAEKRRAYAQARARFNTILQELVDELPHLRRPCTLRGHSFAGTVARRMNTAAQAHLPVFVTPMAAVAGAVADEIRRAMCQDTALRRAYVNNGGDAAFHLAPGEHIQVAIANGAGLADRATIGSEGRARGIATSGWRGRSRSLGIADAVTVVATSAAAADVAATLIANAVDLPRHAAIRRVPANSLDPDTDLGDRLVTAAVGDLSRSEIHDALRSGATVAQAMADRGLIEGAVLFLADESRTFNFKNTAAKELCDA